jgi:hypothetical protein
MHAALIALCSTLSSVTPTAVPELVTLPDLR